MHNGQHQSRHFGEQGTQGTHDLVVVHDGLQTMCDSYEGRIGSKFGTECALNRGVRLVV